MHWGIFKNVLNSFTRKEQELCNKMAYEAINSMKWTSFSSFNQCLFADWGVIKTFKVLLIWNATCYDQCQILLLCELVALLLTFALTRIFSHLDLWAPVELTVLRSLGMSISSSRIILICTVVVYWKSHRELFLISCVICLLSIQTYFHSRPKQFSH